MAKRKVATATSDDEGSTYGSSAAAPSDSDDYEPEPKPPTAKARRVGSATVRGRARKTVSTRVPPTTTATTSAKTDIPHGVMRHVLAAANAETIASTLLTWFATVCTIRGMPWRKPYDPTLSADERSQRAYEVSLETT
jgi:A/G-specific adenine glycosylase